MRSHLANKFSWSSCYSWMPFVLCLVALDQICKCWVLKTFTLGSFTQLLPGLYITQVLNTGIAFSLFAGGYGVPFVLIVLLTLCINILIALALGFSGGRHYAYGLSLACLLGGGLSNLIDRVCYGAVIDYIYLSYAGISWPTIFNIADVLVCIGAALLFLLSQYVEDNDQSSYQNEISPA